MGGPVCFPYRLCRQVADGGPDGGPDGGLGGVRDRSHANSRDPESDPCMAQAWRVLATRAMLSHAIVPRMFHECSTNVPRMFHECSTNVPRWSAFPFGTHWGADAGARGGLWGRGNSRGAASACKRQLLGSLRTKTVRSNAGNRLAQGPIFAYLSRLQARHRLSRLR